MSETNRSLTSDFRTRPLVRWRDPEGASFQIAAMLYIAVAYFGGLCAIVAGSFFWNLVGIFAVAHGLVIAAYLLHECAHQSVFISARHNASLGGILAWLTGACYSGFERVRRKHLRHHIERADILAWDYRAWLQRHPSVRDIVERLESWYLPGVELLVHAAAIILPLVDERYRSRRIPVMTMLIIRGLTFAALAWLNPWAPISYAIAYLLFLQVLRWMDMFQHSYLIRYTLTEPQQQIVTPADYEERHTFTNPLSRRWPWLNLLVLNFCYHNVHHQTPLLPWYRLRQAHVAGYQGSCAQEVGFIAQLRWLHRYRRQRVMAAADDSLSGPLTSNEEMIGGTGVSFVTAV